MPRRPGVAARVWGKLDDTSPLAGTAECGRDTRAGGVVVRGSWALVRLAVGAPEHLTLPMRKHSKSSNHAAVQRNSARLTILSLGKRHMGASKINVTPVEPQRL